MHKTTTLNLRIDWSEMDLFGHVNNVQIIKYVQAARVNFWESTGLNDSFEERKIGAMVAAVSCQFRRPFHYPGNVMIETRIIHLGETSFRLAHRLFDEHGELCAEAEDAEVLYDFNRHEKIVIPTELRSILSEYHSVSGA